MLMLTLSLLIYISAEVARTHISDLLKQLHTEEDITSAQLLQVSVCMHVHVCGCVCSSFISSQAINSVMSRSGDLDSDLSQWKTYLAGFIARAIAQVTIVCDHVTMHGQYTHQS